MLGKKWKYLGSLLDTEEDIKRQKGLPINSYKTFESISSSKHVGEKGQDKSICNIHPKYLPVKHGAVDVDPNPRKQHRYVSKKASKKNHQCQVAKDDLQ